MPCGRSMLVVAVVAAVALAPSCSAKRAPSGPGARYLAIAEPANRRLDHALDAVDDHDRDDLAAAREDLRIVITTEKAFDRDLVALRWPGDAGQTARNLVAVNESRAAITAEAAGARSASRLQAALPRVRAADAVVEAQVRILRAQLDLPPPSSD